MFDDNKDGIEKVIAGFTSLSMVVMMTRRAYTGISELITSVSSTMKVQAAITEALNIASEANNATEIISTGLKAKDLTVTQLLAAEEDKLATSKMATLVAEKTGLGVKQLMIVLQGVANGLTAEEIKQSLGSAAANLSDAAAKFINTAATKGLTAALIELAGVGTIVTVAMLALVAGIVAAVAIYKGFKNHIEETNQAMRDSNNTIIENSKAIKEQNDEKQKLLDSYLEALKIYEETGEGQEDLKNKAIEAADAYGIEGVALANLTGDYKELTQALLENQNARNQQSLESNQRAQKAARDNLLQSMKKGKGYAVGDTYHSNFKGGAFANDEEKAREIVKQGNYQYLGINSSGTVSLDVDIKNFVKGYEEVIAYRDAMLEGMDASERAKSETFKNVDEWLKKSAEDYEVLKDLQENGKILQLEQSANELGIKTRDINNIDDYNNAFNELLDNYTEAAHINIHDAEEWEKARKEVTSYLKSLDSYGKVAEKNEALNEASGKLLRNNLDITAQGLELIMNKYQNPDILWKVNFDHIYSYDQLIAELDRLQAEADLEEIEVKITAVSSVQSEYDKVKKDFSGQNIIDFYEATKDYWETSDVSFTDFLNMMAEERDAFLASDLQAYQQAKINKLQIQKDGYDKEIQALKETDQDAISEKLGAQEKQAQIDYANAAIKGTDNE